MSVVKQQGSERGAQLSDLNEQKHVNSASHDDNITVTNNFMYLNVFVGDRPLTALLDSGSSINVMSLSYFQSIPFSEKSEFSKCDENVVLANNHSVKIFGTAQVRVRKTISSSGGHFVFVYILQDCSHPLILGTEYMRQEKMLLDFGACCSFMNVKKTTKVKCKSTITIDPNSECMVTGQLDRRVNVGMQGVCSGHSEVLNKGLLVSKTLVTCAQDHIVHIKILNIGNEPVHVQKGTILAKFELCDNTVDIVTMKSCSRIHVEKKAGDVNDVTQYSKHTAGDVDLSTPNFLPEHNSANEDFEKFKSHIPSSSDLSPDEQNQLYEVLYKHKQVFTTPEHPDIGFTPLVEHKISLKPDAQTKHQRPYRLPPDKREVLRHQLDELLNQGIIAPVDEHENVPITSPIVLVAKRNKPKLDPGNITKEQSLSSYRFCVDFRYLNTQTQDFRYTIPDLQELTESLADTTPQYMSFLDMSSGFFQIGISADTAKYTAFNTCYGTYKFMRLPMGLRQSPNVFQLLMDKILKGLTFVSVLCYLDDVCICSSSFSKHLQDIDDVLTRFEQSGLKLGPAKCKFGVTKGVFLGHEISRSGIKPPASKLEIVKDYPEPQTRKELERAIGFFNWFRKFIPNFSAVANPLHKLLKKGTSYVWTQECACAFATLKQLLLNSEALAYPRFDLEFRLAVDTSAKGIGYMLYQVHDHDQKRVVRFGSKGLSKWQQSYGPTKLELLGVITSVLDCASYLRGRHFVIECDHQALKPLFQKQLKGAIYERWLAILQQFDCDIQWKSASQMVVPDSLSRMPKYTDILSCSPDEEDEFFPFVPENPTKVRLMSPDGNTQALGINRVGIANQPDLYDADTEDNINHKQCVLPKRVHKLRNKNFKVPELVTTKTLISDSKDASCMTVCENMSCSSETDENDNINLTDNVMLDNNDNVISSSGTDAPCDVNPSDNPVLDNTGNENSPLETDEPCDMNPVDSVVEKDGVLENNSNVNHQIMDMTTPSYTTSEMSAISTDKYASPCTSDNDSDVSTSHTESDSMDSQTSTDSSCHPVFTQLDMTPETIRNCQNVDSDLKPIIKYLNTGKLPKSQQLSRKILLQQSDYILLDGMLFHSRLAKSKRTQQQSHYQLVLPKSMIQTVLQLYHESPLSGHGGIQCTIDRVKEHYFFDRLTTIVTDYVRSCADCQKRKLTNTRMKNAVTSFPSPSQPFSVWEIDLYGPLPCTSKGNAYLFTAVDLFSKLLFVKPIPNKDAASVCEVLLELFTQYGVCDTLISDQGSEFTSKVTREICSMLQVPQQFTPSFVHHCLGACERTHRTLATKLTPYMNDRCNNWDVMVPAIVFSMNNSVNSSTGYSPFEILYVKRPKFPLSPSVSDLKSVPKDYHQYVQQKQAYLDEIRSQVRDNAHTAKMTMLARENVSARNLELTVGDYVYMTDETAVAAKKLKQQYSGPFVVKEIVSVHTVMLEDPEKKHTFSEPIHIDRLKPAYIRRPTPSNFFVVSHKVQEVKFSNVSTQTEDLKETTPDEKPKQCPQTENLKETTPDEKPKQCVRSKVDQNQERTRPKRVIRKPKRFCNSDHVDPSNAGEISSESGEGYHKIKRVLAQRHTSDGVQYLVQIVGEPAQNSIWVSGSGLNANKRPSPVV